MKSVRRNLCPNFDFTVKALRISNSLYRHNFQMKADMNVKICIKTKFCTQNEILAAKIQDLKQQRTSTPLILKGWVND